MKKNLIGKLNPISWLKSTYKSKKDEKVKTWGFLTCLNTEELFVAVVVTFFYTYLLYLISSAISGNNILSAWIVLSFFLNLFFIIYIIEFWIYDAVTFGRIFYKRGKLDKIKFILQSILLIGCSIIFVRNAVIMP